MRGMARDDKRDHQRGRNEAWEILGVIWVAAGGKTRKEKKTRDNFAPEARI